MDKKQYEVMSLIMAKGRKFLDEIFGLMKDNGLTDQAYELSLSIDEMGEIREDMKCDYLLSVELGKDSRPLSVEEWKQTHILHWNKDGKGWSILHDLHGKTEILPEDDYPSGIPSGEPESKDPATGETAESVAESSDGSMWFSADDNDPPMVCRGDLNGNMAESEPGV